MTKTPPDAPNAAAPARSAAPQSKAALKEERLKAALKANMARRKVQVRARSADNTTKNE